MEVRSILLTGGAGYVGVEVLKSLIELYPNWNIVILDNFSKGKYEFIGHIIENKQNVFVECADIRDSDHIEKIITKYKPEIVIHLAAIVDAFATNRKGKDEECMSVNFESAVNLAYLCKKYGSKIFIFQSSVSVYSRGKNMKEDEDKSPLSYYGRAKLLAEKEINKLNDDKFKVCTLRPATVVGFNEGFRYETIINLSCVRSVNNILLTYFESAIHNDKSYLDVKDNVRAIHYAIKNIDKMNGQIFNISSFNTNLDNVISIIQTHLGRNFLYDIVKEKSINQQVYTISAEKIKQYGFEFEGNLNEIIKNTIVNLSKQKNYMKFNFQRNHNTNFDFRYLQVKGLIEVTPRVYSDERGNFLESFHQKAFDEAGIPHMIVQENQSLSKKGVLRGLHIQKYPHGQGKLVRVVKGKVYDVAVDVRNNSETFGAWHGVILSEENKKMLYIPEGFLHGFLTLEEDTILQYKCTNYFNKDSDGGVVWNDPILNVNWKLDEFNITPIISEKDKNLPRLLNTPFNVIK